MRLDFIGSIHTEAIGRVTGQTFVDEVRGLVRPRLVSVGFFKNGVTGHDTLHVGLAVVTRPRLLSFHQFKSNHTDSEPIGTRSVLLSH